jgi:chemotaxis protein CheD
MEQIVVGMADCRIASRPEQVLATYALGSCIGLSVYDSKAGVAGMLHYMLPDSTIDLVKSKENPYMFADTGIPLLVQQVCARGAIKRNLVAHAAGGASIMDPNNIFDIGKRNYLAMRKLLWKAGVMLSGEAVGGGISRTIHLEVGTGNLWLQVSGGKRELVPGFSKSEPAAARPTGGTSATVMSNQKGGTNGISGTDRR